uniref:Uncharacterized protein n=1 Tax=Apteryx owenii TaxID=8824 RepID=A0A8B9P6X1_APTOW
MCVHLRHNAVSTWLNYFNTQSKPRGSSLTIPLGISAALQPSHAYFSLLLPQADHCKAAEPATPRDKTAAAPRSYAPTHLYNFIYIYVEEGPLLGRYIYIHTPIHTHIYTHTDTHICTVWMPPAARLRHSVHP